MPSKLCRPRNSSRRCLLTRCNSCKPMPLRLVILWCGMTAMSFIQLLTLKRQSLTPIIRSKDATWPVMRIWACRRSSGFSPKSWSEKQWRLCFLNSLIESRPCKEVILKEGLVSGPKSHSLREGQLTHLSPSLFRGSRAPVTRLSKTSPRWDPKKTLRSKLKC